MRRSSTKKQPDPVFLIGKGPHSAFAATLLKMHLKMVRFIGRHRDPFIAKVYQDQSHLEMWVTYNQWLEDRRLV
jgi:hypothetical protein